MTLSETTDPDVRKQRIDYIEIRWRQLHERSDERNKEAWGYLTTVNAGGAVAVLGFLGAVAAKAVNPIPNASWMLALFVLGLVFVGLGRAAAYWRSAYQFEAWRRDVLGYYADRTTWSEILNKDDRRSGWFVPGNFLAIVSFACFLAGAFLGVLNVIH